MFKIFILSACALIVNSQYALPPDYGAGVPNPYQFSYSSPSLGGSSSHQEQGDGQGRVTGSYSVTDDDGRSRTVEYVADEGGFRANVVTNEPGTSNQAPADVTISSSAEESYGGAPVYAPGPVSYAPVPVSYGAAPLQYGPAPLQYGPAPLQYGPAPLQYGGAPGGIPFGY